MGFFLFSLVIAIVLFIAGWNFLGICSCGGCILCLLSISKARSEQETNDKKITDENSLKLSKYKSQKEAYDNAMETKKANTKNIRLIQKLAYQKCNWKKMK